MIEDIILISAWCWGIHCLFSEGFVLEKISIIMEQVLGTWTCKPLFLCPPCMASIHGFTWGLFFYGWSWQLIPFIVSLCGLNFILKSFIYPEYEEPLQEEK